MRSLLPFVLLVPAAAAQTPGPAAFRTAGLYGDHMVLPGSRDVPIRGFGPAGAAVAVRGSWGAAAETTIGADGRFTAALHTPAQPGPFEILLRSGAAEIVLHDVLVGDVWLASGQSNMEMPVGAHREWRGGVDDHEREIAAADLPQLRFFTVERAPRGLPADDVEGRWLVSSPKTAHECSAAAFFFGRELLRAGVGPIGLVVSSWGGTIAEAWTSETGLAAFPEFAAGIAAVKNTGGESLAAQQQAFRNALPTQPPAGAGKTVELPEKWSDGELRAFDGVAFYERTVSLPAAFVGQDLVLSLGVLDDEDTTWCNGTEVGDTRGDGSWARERHYRIPAALTNAADGLHLLVRLLDTGGEGGFTNAPAAMHLSLATDEHRQVPLAGPWQRRTGPSMGDLPPFPRDPQGNPNRPTVLWNGMMAPMAPFPFTGAIWYQGESNIGRAEQYSRLLPAMITDWRRAFATELPFYCVQIAPFGYSHDGDLTAELRLAQAAIEKLPHTGMAVTLDVGDARDIHPRNKQAVGRRLALLALADHYGKHVLANGPRVTMAKRDGDVVKLTFDPATGGLVLGDGAGFELAGATGPFAPARASLSEQGQVVLQVPKGMVPARVRYAWGNVPAWSLKNTEGLPARPFVADVQ